MNIEKGQKIKKIKIKLISLFSFRCGILAYCNRFSQQHGLKGWRLRLCLVIIF